MEEFLEIFSNKLEMKLVGENLFRIGQNVEYIDNNEIKGEIIDLRVKKKGLTVKYI